MDIEYLHLMAITNIEDFVTQNLTKKGQNNMINILRDWLVSLHYLYTYDPKTEIIPQIARREFINIPINDIFIRKIYKKNIYTKEQAEEIFTDIMRRKWDWEYLLNNLVKYRNMDMNKKKYKRIKRILNK